jgi:hypothetical protein
MRHESALRGRGKGALLLVALVGGPLALFTASVSCSGGGANLGCPNSDGCGGMLVGNWQTPDPITPHSVCQFVPPLSYSVPIPDPPQIAPQNPKLAKPSSTKSAGSWCQDLKYVNGQIAQINLFHAPAPVSQVGLSLLGSNAYSSTVVLLSYDSTHFDSSCLTAYGDNPSCQDLGDGIMPFYVAMPNFQNVVCCSTGSKANDAGVCPIDPSNGCDCTYTYKSVHYDMGAWQVSGNVLSLYSAINPTQPITTANYCVRDGKLTITGYNGQSMFNVNGLRSATMLPM